MARERPLNDYTPSDLAYNKDEQNELTIIGNKDNITTIEVSVDETLEVEENTDIGSDVIISDKSAELTLGDDLITLAFEGEITELLVYQGNPEFKLNGTLIKY